MIFRTNDKNELVFSMTKLLPVPNGISYNPGYDEYGYDWCCSVWGTKWDAMYCRSFESGNSTIIYYETAWDPNIPWVETLCGYIRTISHHFGNKEPIEISVTHFYCQEYEDIGNEMKWTPDEGFSLIENTTDRTIINSIHQDMSAAILNVQDPKMTC
jgi:hypothetical protein